MKVIVVVDSIVDIEQKINKMKNRFGDNMRFVVKSNLVEIFKTYNHPVDAIYSKQCSTVTHLLLEQQKLDDTVIYFTSLNIDDGLLKKFTNAIGNKENTVVLKPKYNWWERICNKLYNIYVDIIFSRVDSLNCKKLQFIPKQAVKELLDSHIANRLFVNADNTLKEIQTTDKEINRQWKREDKKDYKPLVLNLIIALTLTLFLLISIVAFKVRFILVLTFVLLYMLDLFITVIYAFKLRFDKRFLK